MSWADHPGARICLAGGGWRFEMPSLEESAGREGSSHPVRVSVIPDLIIYGADGDVCAVNTVAVAITDSADLEPIIASKSVGCFKRTLPDWLWNEAWIGVDRQRVMI